MTRDEARAKLNADRDGLWGAGYADRFLTALEELGLLKLDTRAEELTRCAAIEHLVGMFVMTDSAVNDSRQNSMPRRLNPESAAEIIDILTKSGFHITR